MESCLDGAACWLIKELIIKELIHSWLGLVFSSSE